MFCSEWQIVVNSWSQRILAYYVVAFICREKCVRRKLMETVTIVWTIIENARRILNVNQMGHEGRKDTDKDGWLE